MPKETPLIGGRRDKVSEPWIKIDPALNAY